VAWIYWQFSRIDKLREYCAHCYEWWSRKRAAYAVWKRSESFGTKTRRRDEIKHTYYNLDHFYRTKRGNLEIWRRPLSSPLRSLVVRNAVQGRILNTSSSVINICSIGCSSCIYTKNKQGELATWLNDVLSVLPTAYPLYFENHVPLTQVLVDFFWCCLSLFKLLFFVWIVRIYDCDLILGPYCLSTTLIRSGLNLSTLVSWSSSLRNSDVSFHSSEFCSSFCFVLWEIAVIEELRSHNRQIIRRMFHLYIVAVVVASIYQI
jgi:hypothetical protein